MKIRQGNKSWEKQIFSLGKSYYSLTHYHDFYGQLEGHCWQWLQITTRSKMEQYVYEFLVLCTYELCKNGDAGYMKDVGC
ncbi:hypothetical protein BGM25_23980 [Bacillus sp. FJAT-29953]|nr:hypothetical protein [Bacillus sp. FJAT-29953]